MSKIMNKNLSKIFQSDGQQSGELVLSMNWEQHPLGCISQWPNALLVSLGIIFNSRHPMCIFWGEDAFFFYNDGYLPIVGEDKKEWAMGEKTSKVWAEAWNEHVKPQIEHSILKGKASWFVDQLIPIFHEGKLRDAYFTYSNSPLFNESGNIVGALTVCTETTRPVEDKRRLVEAYSQADKARSDLQKSVIELKNERDLRDRFVLALTHDLRTPLTSAKMSAQILAKRTPDSVDVNNFSNKIINNMDRADEMIRDILDASRIKAGEKLPLEIEECNLNELASQTLEDLTTIHGKRFHFKEDGKIIGYWDKKAIRRMIENLANNAVKYGSTETPVTIRLSTTNETVSICVHNEGNSISNEDLRQIFEPFQRAKLVSSQQKGWGIGLTLVRGFAEVHGGKISVKSSPNEGTTFIINIPTDSRNI